MPTDALAYMRIDVSIAYPLTTTGPLYIPLWAYVFLGERLTPLGAAGIVVTFAGSSCSGSGSAVYAWSGRF